MNIVKLGSRCDTWWFFNLPGAKTLIFSLEFDQFDPYSLTPMSDKLFFRLNTIDTILGFFFQYDTIDTISIQKRPSF